MRKHSTAAEKAQYLNHARQVWADTASLSAAVARVMAEAGVGRRQAYRDLHRARRLRGPMPIPDATITFSVKIARGLLQRLRHHARATDATISDVVQRALVAHLGRSRRG
jgi:hypothetical protein